MDYLDPIKKRNHKIRIMFGYGLLAIAIGMATLLLVFVANGFYVDSRGEVIQNGLIFLDSKPSNADIYINGEKQGNGTDARLVLPGSETYDIGIYRKGYKNWTRELKLEGGSLRRITYPRLVPETINSINTTNIREVPIDALQSIDKKWLILSHRNQPLNLSLVNLNDDNLPVTNLTIPGVLVGDPTGGIVEFEEWAEDNRFILLKFLKDSTTKYILMDRTNPASAVDVNSKISLSNVEVSFQDRKRNKYFVYNPPTGQLFTATLETGLNQTPFVDSKVIDYETFENDWVLYVTESGEEGLVEVRFKRGDKDIEIKKIKTDKQYFLELAKLENAPVIGVSSPVEGRAIVYYDPEKYLNENPTASIPVATTVLRLPGIKDLIISSDSSTIIGYNDDTFASHEFEDDRSYRFVNDKPLDPENELRWIDGQHIVFSSEGVQYMADLDGSNINKLVSTNKSIGLFASFNTEEIFSISPSARSASGLALPATLISHSMLAESDR